MERQPNIIIIGAPLLTRSIKPLFTESVPSAFVCEVQNVKDAFDAAERFARSRGEARSRPNVLVLTAPSAAAIDLQLSSRESELKSSTASSLRSKSIRRIPMAWITDATIPTRSDMAMLRRAGVSVIVTWDDPASMIPTAIQHALSGKTFRSPNLLVASKPIHPKPDGDIEHRWEMADKPRLGLSRRQFEVANLAAAGLSNEQIADNLSIDTRTVKAHITGAFRALGIERRTQIVNALVGAAA